MNLLGELFDKTVLTNGQPWDLIRDPDSSESVNMSLEMSFLQVDWYATLLKRALLEASSVEEATEAAEVALSLQPYRHGDIELALEIDAMLARGPTREVGEVWQGPSKRWFTKNKAGRVVPYKPPSGTHEEHVWRGKKKEQVQQAATGAVEKIKALAAVKDLSQAPAREVAATVKDLAQDLKKMTVEQLNALKKELGLKASGPKAELAQKLAQRALAKVRGGTEKPVETPAPEVEKPVTPPVEPEPTPPPEPQPAPEPEPTPEPQPAPVKQNIPAPPQPGFTGEDTLGRRWENGALVGDIAPTPHLSPDSMPARIRTATDIHAVVAQISNLGSDLPDIDSEEEKAKREKTRNDMTDISLKMMRLTRNSKKMNKKEFDEESKLLLDQHSVISDQFEKAIAQRDAVRAEREKIPDKVAEILRSMVKEPEQIFVKFDSSLPDAAKSEFNRGLSWLQGTLQKDAGGERIPLYYVIPAAAGERSFYYSTDNSITFGSSKADNRPAAVHELLHGVEENNTSIAKAVKEFYQYRTAGQPLQKMNDLFPPPAGGKPIYDENEVSRPDNFAIAMGDASGGAYVGKDYGTSRGSEILTMGVQKLLQDPAGFARRDPEYCTFIIGVLNGSLRSAAP